MRNIYKPTHHSTLKHLNVTNLFAYCFVALCLAFTISSCSKKSNPPTPPAPPASSKIDSTGITSGTPEGNTTTGEDDDDLVENSSFTSSVTISFGATVTINNPLSASGVTITQTGQDVVVNSAVSGVEYVVSGTTTNGSVKFYSTKKFKLTLNGANLTSSNGPAINIQASKTAFVVLTDGTTNSVTDNAVYPVSTEDQKGTIFSEGQLVFSGNGSLTVQGNNKHAICSDDYIRVRSGTITVTGSVKDGIHTNDYFIMDGGTVNITSGDDGIECEAGYVIINNGLLTLHAVSHGISASYEDGDPSITPYVTINGGTINAISSASEGIQSKSVITINKGNISTTSVDDGMNADTTIYINGGNVYLNSSANDGMESNGNITITGGKVVAIGAAAPKSGINCGTNPLKITGGIVVGIGGQTSTPDATLSTVNSVILGAGTANELLHIETANNTEALTFLSPVNYSTMLFACSKLQSKTAYNFYTGGKVATGSTSFNGLYTSGLYTQGKKAGTFTTINVVTQQGGAVNQ